MFDVHRNANPRLRVFYLVLSLLFIVLSLGLAYRQVVLSGKYRELEKKQIHRRILVPGPRGNIFDAEGRLLVGNRPRFSAVVYLSELRPEFRREYIDVVRAAREQSEGANPGNFEIEARARVVQRYLDRINEILGRDEVVDRKQMERHFRQNLLLPLSLIRDLTLSEYARLIEQIEVGSPVQVHADSARYYPFGTAAVHILGFVSSTYEISEEGVPGKDLTTVSLKGKIGRTGLERSFDEHLQGISGGEIWVVDPSGFQYRRTTQKQPVKGSDLHTSIDADIQRAAEKGLAQRVGAVAALVVNTGEVLALVSQPNYDLNDLSPFIPNRVYQKISENGAWLNRATAGLYPPGSTFKIITAIAAFEAGTLGPDTTVDCWGSLEVGNRRFACHNPNGHGTVNLEQAITKSCNVFFYKLGLDTGVERISYTARRFGLDNPTGIELPNETRHMIVPDKAWKKRRMLDNWYPGDDANLSIGQGFLRVTPLQMAAFMASFARGEMRTVPTLLKSGEKTARGIVSAGGKLPLSDAQYLRIVNGMDQAAQVGTAKLVRLPGIRIAGKTGTAQVRSNNENLTLAWFIGFAPVDHPEIAIAVLVEGTEPEDQYAGGTTAAPIARAVFKSYFDKQGHPSPGDFAATSIP
jgi:penicillin-binding protein 2